MTATATATGFQVPLVDLSAQYRDIRGEIDDALQRVLDETNFILGEEVERFESEFAAYLGAAGAVGVASGTAALHLALRACGVGPGDEVVTSAHTFMATVEAICQVGARPVFADIDPATYTIDPARVEAALTPRTRAVIPVHLYGHPAAMDALEELCADRNLHLIEDAAQAHGAELHGRRCGTFGQLACFSFYPGKNLGAYGDAGAVTGNDVELLSRIRRLRDHGRTAKYVHAELGFAERIDTIQAAVLRVKLRHLDDWTDARREHARRYSELLSATSLVLPGDAPGARHVYHLYVVRSPRRDELHERLRRDGIGAGIHYPVPAHLQDAWRVLGTGNSSLPHTETAAGEVLSLPLYPELRTEQIDYVVERVRSAG
jgi:dTDP-4-amino-4,6-dideoxygalactose transaminase